jgi:integrase
MPFSLWEWPSQLELGLRALGDFVGTSPKSSDASAGASRADRLAEDRSPAPESRTEPRKPPATAWDTPLLFPGARGGYLNLNEWRRDEWTPAVKGAGLEHRFPYALRHTSASFAIAAGVPLFELSRFMGTSVEQIGRTYGHLLPDSLERASTAGHLPC